MSTLGDPLLLSLPPFDMPTHPLQDYGNAEKEPVDDGPGTMEVRGRSSLVRFFL